MNSCSISCSCTNYQTVESFKGKELPVANLPTELGKRTRASRCFCMNRDISENVSHQLLYGRWRLLLQFHQEALPKPVRGFLQNNSQYWAMPDSLLLCSNPQCTGSVSWNDPSTSWPSAVLLCWPEASVRSVHWSTYCHHSVSIVLWCFFQYKKSKARCYTIL